MPPELGQCRRAKRSDNVLELWPDVSGCPQTIQALEFRMWDLESRVKMVQGLGSGWTGQGFEFEIESGV